MTTFTVLFAISLIALIGRFIYNSKVKKSGYKAPEVFPEDWRFFLQQKVQFYANLNLEEKLLFESKIQYFLGRIRITGVKTLVDEEDRLLVASSAVIPIFRFPEWEYKTLYEVLLYPDLFTEEYDFNSKDRTISGMVGDGAVMSHVVLFSKPALRMGFDIKNDKHNVGIHEFVHLFDKQDGSVDGIPSVIMQHQAVLPWLNLISKNTAEMIKGKSDINVYGATNPQEFLAVTSEYFFERPELFKEKHPELYEVLSSVFQNDLARKKD